jgi:hypothetical protein
MLRGMTWRQKQSKRFGITLVLGSVALVCGCGASSPSIASEPRAEPVQPTQSASTAALSPSDPRSLPAHATFKQLADAANRLDQRALDSSSEGCLLENPQSADGVWKLKADIAVGVRPLPEPPTDLASGQGSPSEPVTILSRWGRRGDAPNALTLVAFTTTSASGVKLPALALLITKAGLWLRSVAATVDALPTGPLKPEQLAPILAARIARSEQVLYITAEAETPLSDVYSLLASLPSQKLEVALAVALPPGTRLPSLSVPAEAEPADASRWCPAGLPEVSGNIAEGDLPGAALADALKPLREAAQACLANEQRALATGGKVTLALRIGADGRVQTACLLDDEIREVTFADCLLRAARQQAFPHPQPPGLVDVHLPLAFSSSAVPRQNPVCL